MLFATISESGQITLPLEIQKALKLKSGDKVKFYVNNKNEVVICNSSITALQTAQKAFEGTADRLGLSSEDDVQVLVDEFRGRSFL